MKRLVAISALLLSFTANAVEDWIVVAQTDSTVFAVKSSSFSYQTLNGTPYITILYSIKENNGTLHLARWNVTERDCKAGYGQLISTELGTNRIKFKNDFAFDAKNIASYGAEVLCIVAGGVPKQPATAL